MTRSTLLEKLYQHAFDMVQFGESKNTTLISFNVAAIMEWPSFAILSPIFISVIMLALLYFFRVFLY